MGGHLSVALLLSNFKHGINMRKDSLVKITQGISKSTHSTLQLGVGQNVESRDDFIVQFSNVRALHFRNGMGHAPEMGQ